MERDAELARRARRGSPAAAELLVDRHWAGAWRTAYALVGSRDDADDVVQEAFERAFRSLRRFDGRSSFRTWLHRIVVNCSLDALRRMRHAVPSEHVTSCFQEEDEETDTELRSAIAALASERRTVIVLRYWLDLSPPDIAVVLAIPVGTVHSRLARALDDLRTTLEVEDGRPAR
jgi:RNA polymerase sigma-70 factor (ECF subfamily)